MDAKERLERNLLSEAEAYGYTLSVWGSGALLIHVYHVPSAPAVLLFVLGGLLAFATMAAVAFSRPFRRVEADADDTLIAASIIHVVATLGNLLLAWGVIGGLDAAGVGLAVSALVVGYQTSLAYNLLLLLEARLARLLV